MDGCVAFGDVVRQLRVADARPLIHVTAELTRRCTFSCPHCYCRLPQDDAAAARELSGAEWKRILTEAAEEGAVTLLVTGGEPLLHPDFREIWIGAKRLGLVPDLYTNASLITPEMADFLAMWPPRQVSITLYGATEETYRAMTGRKGMRDRVLEAVGLLRDRGLGVEIKGMFTRTNAHELAAVRAHAAPEGGTFRWGAELIGTVEGSHGRPESVTLSGEQIIALEKTDPVRWAEWEKTFASWQPAPPSSGRLFRCGIGRSNMHVDPYGIMRACEFVETVAYDLKRGAVREGWRHTIPDLLEAFPSKPGPCQQCALTDVCRVCPGHALVAGQPAAGPTVAHCELGRARAQALGLNAVPYATQS